MSTSRLLKAIVHAKDPSTLTSTSDAIRRLKVSTLLSYRVSHKSSVESFRASHDRRIRSPTRKVLEKDGRYALGFVQLVATEARAGEA